MGWGWSHLARVAAMALAAIALSIGAAGCGGGDDGDSGDGGSPSSADVPSGAVATVGDAEISDDQLDDQVAVLVRAQRASGKGKLSKAQREQIEAQALAMLLQTEALEQEAADRGIEVSEAEVRKRWEQVSKGQFKTREALRQFLGGQKVADVLAQLRLQTMAERIQQDVSEEAGGGKDGAQAVKQFQQRWQERTACAEGYTAAGCATDSK